MLAGALDVVLAVQRLATMDFRCLGVGGSAEANGNGGPPPPPADGGGPPPTAAQPADRGDAGATSPRWWSATWAVPTRRICSPASTTWCRMGVADPERIGVIGGSYGGFMAAWLPCIDQRFAAAVSIAPVTDWYSERFDSNLGRWASDFLGGDAHATQAHYRERSPVFAGGHEPDAHTAHGRVPRPSHADRPGRRVLPSAPRARCPVGSRRSTRWRVTAYGRSPAIRPRRPVRSPGSSDSCRPTRRRIGWTA